MDLIFNFMDLGKNLTLKFSRVENEVVAENCVVEVEEKPPVLPPPPPPPAPTTPPPPPPPASLHRHPVARKAGHSLFYSGWRLYLQLFINNVLIPNKHFQVNK